MKVESFKSGRWQQRYQYKSFEPVPVNHVWTWEDPGINTLLEQATRALAELNAFSLIVPDIDLFIQMHIIKEAQSSSKIEGTQTGIDEILLPEEKILPEKRDDWHEVQNYISAINQAVAELPNLPLSNRLLRQTHATLMQGVRGAHKQPGDYRNSQNWIGGSSLADAAFIPPHHDGVPDLMGDLEAFWHNQDIAVPHLIRVAISHYQFETIHPFLDGNGRIGRLLIPLYLSDFFERNRASYYDALMQVRISNDLSHWLRFFLTGVAQTATKGRDVFRQILALRTRAEQAILGLGKRAPLAWQALDHLYRQPIVDAYDLKVALGVSRPTANTIIKLLIENEILSEMTGQERYRAYAFEPYLNLF